MDNNNKCNKDFDKDINVDKVNKEKQEKVGDDNMSIGIMKNFNSNIFEFEVSKGKLKEVLERFNKPGLTKEYLDECNKIAEKYRKPSK